MSKKIIKGDVDLSNLHLTAFPDFLEDLEIEGDFNCINNNLTTLKGCPQTIGGHLLCTNNNLTTLEGCPQTIGGSIEIVYNKLASLKGCPQTVGENFYCYGNPTMFTEEQIRAVCDVKGEVHV
jgi:hypothetical protein